MTSTSDPKPIVTGYPAAAPTAGTAYPYPPPPPHAAPYYAAAPQPNPYYAPTYPYNNNNNRNNLFLRRLLAVAIAVFLIIGAVTFIIWLILRPKLPVFSISSLNLSSFNLSSSSLTSNFDLTLTIQNPNRKMSINYNQATVAVLYGRDSIAQTSLPPFYQQKGNVTEVRAKMAAVGEYVEEDVVKGIRSDRGNGDGMVRFNVRLLSLVRFRSGVWSTRSHVLRVFCEGVGVVFKNAAADVGSMVGAAKRCQVGL